MAVLSKDIKLLTLSLILRTMPKEQRSLLMAHFNPDVARVLTLIEQQTNVDVEKLDWTPFYQAGPELQRILSDCKREMKSQRTVQSAEEQRPKLREYILMKLGVQKKGAPVFLSQDVMRIIDQFLTTKEKM